jgi:F0F1-type ATP synthase membrane subunit b/b'
LNDKNTDAAVAMRIDSAGQLNAQKPSTATSVLNTKDAFPMGAPSITVMTNVGTTPIQDSAKPFSTDWIAVGSFILAILSFIVTAWIVWSAMKQQIKMFLETIRSQEKIAAESKALERKKVRADILSRNRQDWINSLRNELSELISSANTLVQNHALLSALAMPDANADSERKLIYSEITKERGILHRHKAKIELLLNPTEPHSIEIVKKMDELTNKVNDFTIMTVESITESIIELGQTVLKTEWERVKLLEGYDQ